MTTTDTRTLDEKHSAELRASGLTDGTIEAAGIYSAQNAEVRELLGWQPKYDWGRAMIFPYPGCDGYARLKPDYPRPATGGKYIKYEAPKGQPNHAYIPPGSLDRPGPVIITEGEKKTLAIWQAGYAVIGLSGVWAWHEKRDRTDTGRAYGQRRLISELDAIDWKGREAVFGFDSDASANAMVRLAECRLSEVLQSKGAAVRVARIPADGNKKVGADDYIVAHGAAAFHALIREAKEAEKPPTPSPMDYARMFTEEFFTEDAGLTLRWQNNEFYRHVGAHYVRVPEGELHPIVLEWLDKLTANAKPSHAAEVVKALAAVGRVPYSIEQPALLTVNGCARHNWLAFANGIIDLDAATMGEPVVVMPHTAAWFSQFSLPYDYDPTATCDRWFTTLDEIFDGDVEMVEALGELFGYCLTNDTSQHKILLLVGPPRSGKSTILRALQYVIGPQNCVNPRLSTLAETFGLWGLVGKRLAICPDAHLGHGDKAMATMELLKSISGEDPLEVHRKHLPSVTMRLRVRLALAVNELPRFGDSANALSPRLLLLPCERSFIGRENRGLEAELEAEAPGILNWAIDGLRRLRKQGRFTEPGKSQAILRDFERLTSPVKAFIEDRCEIGAEKHVDRDTLWATWREWCKDTGQHEGTRERFGSVLKLHVPGLSRFQPRTSDGKARNAHRGIGLR